MHLFGNMQKPEQFWQHNIAKKWIKPLLGELILQNVQRSKNPIANYEGANNHGLG